MFPITAKLHENGNLQMTFRYNSHFEGSAKALVTEYTKVEVLCSAEIKKQWCDLRDAGKFSTDVHFLSHLLNLEKLWQSGSLDVVTASDTENVNKPSEDHCRDYFVYVPPPTCSTNASISEQQYEEYSCNKIYNCVSSQNELSNTPHYERPSYKYPTTVEESFQNDHHESKSDFTVPPETFGSKVYQETSAFPSDKNLADQFQENKVDQVKQNPATLKLRDHKSESSESGSESFVEDLDMYTVEIDVDKHYPSLHVEESCSTVSNLEETEEMEMRKRPLRKRLKKIVQTEFRTEMNLKSLPEIKKEVNSNTKEEENHDIEKETILKNEEKEVNGKQGCMKRWSTRRLPAAASAYMKVMRIGGRISPDRKGIPSTNTLTLKTPRGPGKNKICQDLDDDDDLPNSKAEQLAELVYSHASREIKCPVCALIVPSKKDFVIHLEEHVKSDNLCCVVCKVKAETKTDLIQHLQTHAEKTYKCDKCSNHFNNRHRLNIHFFEHLTDEAKHDFRCDVCGKPCYSKCYLQRHRRRHTGEKPYMCDVCGKVYYEMSTLNTHRRSHTDERFTCDLCGNRYMQKSALNLHMKSAHEGIKEHMCEMCGKAFFDKHHLQKHIRIHTGEKPYQCEFCGKSFTQKVNRDQHRRLHTGEQPYRCEYCLRTFALRAAYTQHVRKHTGIKVSDMKRVQLEKLQEEWSKKKTIN